MSNNFGYLDIILLAMIAGFIILRLRNILGRKTGHQDKVYSDFAQKNLVNLRKQMKQKQKNLRSNLIQMAKNNFLKEQK